MGKHEALIASIMDKLRQKTAHREPIYHDEPILFTASRMRGFLPEKYQQMKAIATTRSFTNEADLFVEQARFMADMEDDCPYTESLRLYFPTYRCLNDRQLRGYFTWRTKVRKGVYEATPLSFIFLHIYELIALVGAASPDDAYQQIQALNHHYGEAYPTLSNYVSRWLDDLNIVYDLHLPFVSVEIDRPFDAALAVLDTSADYDSDAILTALCAVSRYRADRSSYASAHRDAIAFVAAHVWEQLREHNRRRCKTPLFEKLFGSACVTVHSLFTSAVWQPPTELPHTHTIAMTPFCRFSYENGLWMKYTACGTSRSKELTQLLKAIDERLRLADEFPDRLQPVACPLYQQKMIDRAIAAWRNEQARRERTVLRIDRASFHAIRDRAAVTRDRLLTEEERDGDDTPFSSLPPDPPAPPSSADDSDSDGLSPVGRQLLCCILNGGDAVALAKDRRILLSVEVEAINDALFDDFGDTVIDWDGDIPIPVPDYIDDLKGRMSL